MYEEIKYTKNDINKILKNFTLLHKNKTDEEFRQVILNNFYTQYLISNFGRVISTNYRGHGKANFMKQKINDRGYYEIMICVKKERKSVMVHRLVGQAFIPNPDNKPFINHKDGVKTNNFFTNLEWCTPKENTQHAHDNNLCYECRGEEIGNSKYKNDQIIKVCELLQETEYNFREISELTKVTPEMISRIYRRKNWRHIADNYSFKERQVKNLDQVRKVCAMLETNKYTILQISQATGMSYKMVIKIKNGLCYTYISKYYKISNYKNKSNNRL